MNTASVPNGNGWALKSIWWTATTLGGALLAFGSTHVVSVTGTLAKHGERLAAIETHLRNFSRQLDRIEDRVTARKDQRVDPWQEPMSSSVPAAAVLSAVRVSVPGSQGSGCIVNWQGTPFILTCAHVVRPPGMPAAVRAEVTLPDQQKQFATIVSVNAPLDLAVLQTSLTGSYLALEIAATDPAPQTPILAIGYPGGALSWHLHQGYVAQAVGGPTLNGRAALVTSFAPTAGVSGAAVLRQSDHALVGLIAERRQHAVTGQTDGIAIRSCDLRTFLQQVCPGGSCLLPPRALPAPSPPSVDLRAEVEALRRRLDGIKGVPGERGPPGPPGAAADLAPLKEEITRLRLEIDTLRKQFNSLSGTIRVQVEPITR